MSKPSDLIPELQGRFPIRVELDSLTVEPSFVAHSDREPDASLLTAQYRALLGTERVALEFTTDGVRRIAEIAHQVNTRTENIGARRLHTVMETPAGVGIVRSQRARCLGRCAWTRATSTNIWEIWRRTRT